jgi:dCTP deaminase
MVTGGSLYTLGPMILSDRDLKIELESGRVVVDPLGANAIQPSSIDLRIGRHFRIFANTRYPYIDVRKPMEGLTELVEVTGEEPFILHPGEFVLGTTLERVAIPDDLVGRLEGKSSLGRLGLLIHSTAGFVDAGFAGNLTLELSNVANLPITLYPGMKIGQISLFRMSSPAEHPYGSNRLGSKYLDQVGPTPSRYWENFEVQPEAPDGPSSKRPSSK